MPDAVPDTTGTPSVHQIDPLERGRILLHQRDFPAALAQLQVAEAELLDSQRPLAPSDVRYLLDIRWWMMIATAVTSPSLWA